MIAKCELRGKPVYSQQIADLDLHHCHFGISCWYPGKGSYSRQVLLGDALFSRVGLISKDLIECCNLL